MIKFFRKIRQKTLTDSKFGKYFLYAIGEIILVVIGILIALSINNWNNNKIKASEEASLLQDMVVDLKQNVHVANNAINIHQNTLKHHIALRQILLKKVDDKDRITFLIRSLTYSSTPTFSTSTYKTLSRTGLNIINSDTLRKSILNYYEYILPYVNYKSNGDPKNQFQELLLPYFNTYFKIELNADDSIARTITNSAELFNDNEFLNVLHNTIYKRKRLIEHLNTGKENSEFLIKEINNYLTH